MPWRGTPLVRGTILSLPAVGLSMLAMGITAFMAPAPKSLPGRTTTISTLTNTGSEIQPSPSLTLSVLQQRAAPMIRSFVPNEFRPWIPDRHVQTIGGFLWGELCPYVPPDDWSAMMFLSAAVGHKLITRTREDGEADERNAIGTTTTTTTTLLSTSSSSSFWHSRERIETPDGDWFHADYRFAVALEPSGNSTGGGPVIVPPVATVILCHGLESNSHSRNSIEMAQAFNEIGMNCICLNFRGCTGIPNNKFSGYHLGFTEDLHYFLNLFRLRHQHNPTPLYLAGFSMGANVVLKCLGELAERAVLEYNIQGGAVFCPPLNQTRNALVLAQPGINRLVYTGNLLRKLKQRTKERVDLLLDGNQQTDLFDYPKAMAAQTISEFDDVFHRGVNGFRDCWDYYNQTSCIGYLDHIAVPTLLLGAQDDPFFDPEVWPVEKSSEYGGTVPLKMVHTPYGGHLGYFLHQVTTYNDPRLQKRSSGPRRLPPSWGPMELARFLDHIHSQQQRQQQHEQHTTTNAYSSPPPSPLTPSRRVGVVEEVNVSIDDTTQTKRVSGSSLQQQSFLTVAYIFVRTFILSLMQPENGIVQNEKERSSATIKATNNMRNQIIVSNELYFLSPKDDATKQFPPDNNYDDSVVLAAAAFANIMKNWDFLNHFAPTLVSILLFFQDTMALVTKSVLQQVMSFRIETKKSARYSDWGDSAISIEQIREGKRTNQTMGVDVGGKYDVGLMVDMIKIGTFAQSIGTHLTKGLTSERRSNDTVTRRDGGDNDGDEIPGKEKTDLLKVRKIDARVTYLELAESAESIQNVTESSRIELLPTPQIDYFFGTYESDGLSNAGKKAGSREVNGVPPINALEEMFPGVTSYTYGLDFHQKCQETLRKELYEVVTLTSTATGNATSETGLIASYQEEYNVTDSSTGSSSMSSESEINDQILDMGNSSASFSLLASAAQSQTGFNVTDDMLPNGGGTTTPPSLLNYRDDEGVKPPFPSVLPTPMVLENSDKGIITYSRFFVERLASFDRSNINQATETREPKRPWKRETSRRVSIGETDTLTRKARNDGVPFETAVRLSPPSRGLPKGFDLFDPIVLQQRRIVQSITEFTKQARGLF